MFRMPSKAKTYALLFLLSISLGFNGKLVLDRIQFYGKLGLTRLDPLGNIYFPFDHDEGPVDVVFIGDSRASHWPAPISIDDIQYANRGVGGQTSTQVAQRFEESVYPVQPKVIVIQICINDLKMVPFLRGIEAEIIEHCKSNILEMIELADEINAHVVVTQIFPLARVTWTDRLYYGEEIDDAIDEVNRFLLSLDADHVTYLETSSILADSSGRMKEEYALDFLHLSDSGYAALNRELVPILADVLGKEGQALGALK